MATPVRSRALGTGTYEVLTEALIARELPRLAPERRDETVGFASRRFQQMASPVRIGLQAAMIALAVPTRVIGARRVTAWLTRSRLPLIGDVPRAIRYLVVTYVWESWPTTRPDGQESDR